MKIRDGQMESIMKGSPAPSVARLVHERFPSAKVVALGGHKYYASDAIGGPYADVIMYYAGTPGKRFGPTAVPGHVPPAGIMSQPDLTYKNTSLPLGVEDHLAMQLAAKTFDRMHQTVTFINEPEFDYPLGHVWGASRDPTAVTSLMQQFDRDLGDLEDHYRKAGVLDHTLFVVTADHGFSGIYHTVPKAELTKAVSDAGTSIVSDTYHTASYLWIKDKSRAAQTAANISHLQNPYIQSVYFRSQRPQGSEYLRATGASLMRVPGMEQANQHLLQTFNGPNGPDVAVFFTEGAASLPEGQRHWKGDHGGNDWNAQHLPLVFSGPGVRKGFVSDYPARLEDIAPTALSLMGVSHTGMQGMPLADAITSSSQAEKMAQQQQAVTLRAVIDPLRSESATELKLSR